MRKANKTRFIILLSIALLFIIGTVTLLFIPEPKPLKVTEKLSVINIDGKYSFQGKLKNVSDNEIVLHGTNFEVYVKVINDYDSEVVYTIRFNYTDSVTIQPNGEFDLSELPLKLIAVKSAEISKVIYYPEKSGVTIYGNVINNGSFALFALLTGVIGLAFLIISIVSYRVDINNTKRVNNIIELVNETFENGTYVAGYYGNKAENRSAAAKTTASVFGAVISAIFLGFGRYRVYSQSSQSEFIITENAIYMYINGKFNDVTNELKSVFINPVVTAKKSKISIRGENKNIYLTLLSKDGSEEKAELLSKLQNIFNT